MQIEIRWRAEGHYELLVDGVSVGTFTDKDLRFVRKGQAIRMTYPQ